MQSRALVFIWNTVPDGPGLSSREAPAILDGNVQTVEELKVRGIGNPQERKNIALKTHPPNPHEQA